MMVMTRSAAMMIKTKMNKKEEEEEEDDFDDAYLQYWLTLVRLTSTFSWISDDSVNVLNTSDFNVCVIPDTTYMSGFHDL